MHKTLDECIRQFCNQKNISLSTLAKQAGMSRVTLYKMLEEEHTPTLDKIVQLASAVNMHPQYLLKLKWSSFHLQQMSSQNNKNRKKEKQYNDATVFIDETFPDNSIIAAGATFTKTWTVQNVGDVVWKNRMLICIDDSDNQSPANLKPEQPIVPIPLTIPGETVTLSVQFTAPEMPARVISYWKSVNENGELSFPNATGLYVAVKIVASSAMTHAF